MRLEQINFNDVVLTGARKEQVVFATFMATDLLLHIYLYGQTTENSTSCQTRSMEKLCLIRR
jgi:hypothetical protein